MALPNLTGNKIKDTYQRVVTTDGTSYYDGTGSLLDIASSTDIPSTASLLTTASATNNTITFTKGNGSTFNVIVNTGSLAGYATETYVLSQTSSLSSSLAVNIASNTALINQEATDRNNADVFITSITIPTAIAAATGSLLKTASVNLNTITFTKGDNSTFNLTINTGSGGGGGVTQLVAGIGISLSPAGGTGVVTITNTGGGGGATFPYTGSAIISGSLIVTGSTSVQYIDFDKSVTPEFAEGRVNWVDDTKTLAIDTDVNDVQIEVGHQTVTRVRNENTFTLLKGRVVYMSGSQGNRPLIYTSSWESDPTSAGTLGLVAADITQNSNGYVITQGLIRGLNTSMFTAGQPLFLSSSGQITANTVISPLHEVRLGKVVTSHASTGIIYVDIDNGYEIGELHDVIDNSTNSTHGALLVKSGSVWKDGYQLTGSYGLTGSLNVTSGGITSSLFGTASWASNAVTASHALSGVTSISAGSGISINQSTGNVTITNTGGGGGATFPYTGSAIISGSLIVTGALNTTQGGIDAIRIKETALTNAGQYDRGVTLADTWSSTGPALTAGKVVYLSGSGQWAEAVASSTGSSAGVLGVVTTTANQNDIVLHGLVRLDQSLAGFINGNPIYLSPTTAGTVTQTPPSTAGQVGRYIGYVIDSGSRQIYFNPDFTWIQL